MGENSLVGLLGVAGMCAWLSKVGGGRVECGWEGMRRKSGVWVREVEKVSKG